MCACGNELARRDRSILLCGRNRKDDERSRRNAANDFVVFVAHCTYWRKFHETITVNNWNILFNPWRILHLPSDSASEYRGIWILHLFTDFTGNDGYWIRHPHGSHPLQDKKHQKKIGLHCEGLFFHSSGSDCCILSVSAANAFL